MYSLSMYALSVMCVTTLLLTGHASSQISTTVTARMTFMAPLPSTAINTSNLNAIAMALNQDLSSALNVNQSQITQVLTFEPGAPNNTVDFSVAVPPPTTATTIENAIMGLQGNATKVFPLLSATYLRVTGTRLPNIVIQVTSVVDNPFSLRLFFTPNVSVAFVPGNAPTAKALLSNDLSNASGLPISAINITGVTTSTLNVSVDVTFTVPSNISVPQVARALLSLGDSSFPQFFGYFKQLVSTTVLPPSTSMAVPATTAATLGNISGRLAFSGDLSPVFNATNIQSGRLALLQDLSNALMVPLSQIVLGMISTSGTNSTVDFTVILPGNASATAVSNSISSLQSSQLPGLGVLYKNITGATLPNATGTVTGASLINSATTTTSSALSPGAIAAIVVVSVVFGLALLGLGIYALCTRGSPKVAPA